MPPFCAVIDASCSSIVATGSLDASIAAPCPSLVLFSSATGIQTNLAWDFSGRAERHRAAQWGHCGSKKTYTVRTLMGEPTVKPFASASTAATVTGVVAPLPATAASGASLQAESTRPAARAAVMRWRLFMGVTDREMWLVSQRYQSPAGHSRVSPGDSAQGRPARSSLQRASNARWMCKWRWANSSAPLGRGAAASRSAQFARFRSGASASR